MTSQRLGLKLRTLVEIKGDELTVRTKTTDSGEIKGDESTVRTKTTDSGEIKGDE